MDFNQNRDAGSMGTTDQEAEAERRRAYDEAHKPEAVEEHTLADELKEFNERFPKIGALVEKAAKYFGG